METSQITPSRGQQKKSSAGQTGSTRSKKRSKKKKKASAATIDSKGAEGPAKASMDDESIEQLLIDLNIQQVAPSLFTCSAGCSESLCIYMHPLSWTTLLLLGDVNLWIVIHDPDCVP